MQRRNSEMVDILRPDFQHRNEPNFAWKSAVSALEGLPVIRGAWPMSVVNYLAAAQAVDVSGNGYVLTNNNVAVFGYDDLAPYVEFNGTTQYLSRADGGAANWADIIGTEAYVVATQRGFACGGWFWFDGLTGTGQYCITKGSAAQDSYALYRTNGRIGAFWISTNGAAWVQVTTGAVTVSDSAWHCMVGRFDPSTAVELFVDGTWYQTVAGVPATIWDGTAPFCIGAYGTPSNYLDGKASLCFLSACDMPDAAVFSFYEQTRSMFGV